MGTLRKKLYVTLMFGFLCALLIFIFGVREGMHSPYLKGEPVPIRDTEFLPQSSDDTGEKMIRPGNSSDGLVETPPPAFGLNDDTALNIRKEDVIQMALPPDNEPKLSAEELLDQTMREINEGLIPSSQSKNSSFDSLSILGVWHHWRPILNRSDILPESTSAMEEGLLFWRELMKSMRDEIKQEQRVGAPMAYAPAADDSFRQCPYSVSELNSTELLRDDFVLEVPCGLVVDSSITLVGIPRGVMGDFKINLLGERPPGEQSPSIILHYNVRLHGDMMTNTSVIVENSWTLANDWQEEERCPPIEQPENVTTVDNLSKCLDQVGKPVLGRGVAGPKWPGRPSKEKLWFPFVEGYPFAATLRVGVEGFHMTVNGWHLTSYGYRQNLEPWMVSGVEAKGDLELSSMMVTGLPYVEEVDHVADLEFLKAPPLPGVVSMLIGIVSTSNNFDRRMAIRRTWMQAKEVRSGKVAVRFFVGLHKTKQVNKELWNEATTYGDVQLMPFVDYYHLITLKTLAICIFTTTNVMAEFVMKTDDDTFVRVDEVLALVTAVKTPNSLLYGRMEFEAIPHRNRDDKWFVSEEEFSEPKYPPWAHGPGYVISRDIANFVVQRHKHKQLQIFKLEDVAMGIWVRQFRNTTETEVDYINNDSFLHSGCADGYVIAHYRTPRQMLCMWEKLIHGKPKCCNV